MDEASEVRRIASGDQLAFKRLAQVYLPAIEFYALRLTSNRALAEDVAQETLLTLWLKAADYDPKKARLTTWLHQIAYYRVIDALRVAQRYSSADAEVPDTTAEDATDAERASAAGIKNALLSLPERQRNALVLTYYQEFTNREVAMLMGISRRAVESLLVRARQAVRQALETANGSHL